MMAELKEGLKKALEKREFRVRIKVKGSRPPFKGWVKVDDFEFVGQSIANNKREAESRAIRAMIDWLLRKKIIPEDEFPPLTLPEQACIFLPFKASNQIMNLRIGS